MTGTDFLVEIVATLREELAHGEYARGVPQGTPSGSRPSLRAAVERDRPHGALIVELKHASPGRPDPLLPPRTVPEFLALTQTPAVVGYSCLATRPRFLGSPALVAELVRSTRRPVLYKEFVVATEQLEVAARTGASAVLLIARLEQAGLLDRPLHELARHAHHLGLEVLLELHAPEEVGLLDGVAADLVGVNVRDLATLAIERERALATIEAVRPTTRAPLIGLSGVDGPGEADRFWQAGCDGLLVGSAVARSGDPASFLRSLRRPGVAP